MLYFPTLRTVVLLHYLAKNRKPGNCIFSLQCCMLLYQHIQSIFNHLVTVEPPSFPKRSPICTRHDLVTIIASFVTHMLNIQQVHHGVGHSIN